MRLPDRSAATALWLAAALCGLAAAPADAEECREVRFARGASSAVIEGVAPADGTLCYAMRTGAGQSARLEVLEGSNTAFSVEGLADARDAFSFETRATTYRIHVFQMLRAAQGQPFRLLVAVE